jgi:invasion protein IalB
MAFMSALPIYAWQIDFRLGLYHKNRSRKTLEPSRMIKLLCEHSLWHLDIPWLRTYGRSMSRLPILPLLAIFTSLTVSAAQAAAPKMLGTYKDWSALMLVQGGEKQCYMVSEPKSKTPKGVRRGKVYLMVTHWPAREIVNEVSIVTGYPYKKGSEVKATIRKSKNFTLFTSEDRAWANNAKEDRAMVKALKAGASVTATGTSARGTVTKDKYSLRGFTAAYRAISEACKVKGV